MEEKILQQILSKLDSMEIDVKEMKTDMAGLKSDVAELKAGQQKLEVILENEIRRDMRIIAEGHLSLNQKMDDLKEMYEKVPSIQDDVSALKYVAKENLYDLKILKMAKSGV